MVFFEGFEMMYTNDFVRKQILIYEPYKGDKISYQNDNLVIRDANKQIKYQTTQILFAAILEYKEDIFIYIRDYYRAVMKEKAIDEYPVFVME